MSRSIATVMRPTPPGTGVMTPATSTADAKSTSPQSLPASSRFRFSAVSAIAAASFFGTTTTPAKVDKLKEDFDDVRVVEGGDREAIRDALAGCDGLVVTVGPRLVYVEADEEHITAYASALRDRRRGDGARWDGYRDRFVDGPADHAAYLDACGGRAELERRLAHGAAR